MTLPILRRNGHPVAVRQQTAPFDNQMSTIDPWNDYGIMNRLFDRLMGNPFSVFGHGPSHWLEGGETNLELYETNDEFLAYLDIPGVHADSFDVSANAESITVKAERKPLLEMKDGLVSHNAWKNSATAVQNFSATCTLPAQINPDKVSATYKDGVLMIKMVKSEAAKPSHIKVDVTG